MLIEVIQTEDALLAIKDEWQLLTATVPASIDFFGGWDHAWHAVRIIQPSKWFVVAVRESEDKRLVAVFTWELLNLQAEGKAYRAVQPLASTLAPYVEFAIEPLYRRPALKALIETLAQTGIDLICLWPLHEASPIFNTLTEDMRNSDSLSTFRYPSNLREIETRALDYTYYCRRKSNTAFTNAQYRERRLSKEGTLRFTLCEPLPAAAEIAADLAQASAIQFGDAFAYRSRPSWQDWVVEMVKTLADTGTVQVSTLRLNDAIIASGLCFWDKGRRYFYLTHFDQTYARFSPGKVLLHRLIKQTFTEQGIFCFGAGNNRYKDQWARSQGELKAAFIFMNTEAKHALNTVVNRDFIARLAMA